MADDEDAAERELGIRQTGRGRGPGSGNFCRFMIVETDCGAAEQPWIFESEENPRAGVRRNLRVGQQFGQGIFFSPANPFQTTVNRAGLTGGECPIQTGGMDW